MSSALRAVVLDCIGRVLSVAAPFWRGLLLFRVGYAAASCFSSTRSPERVSFASAWRISRPALMPALAAAACTNSRSAGVTRNERKADRGVGSSNIPSILHRCATLVLG
jgi:hypothetical protein